MHRSKAKVVDAQIATVHAEILRSAPAQFHVAICAYVTLTRQLDLSRYINLLWAERQISNLLSPPNLSSPSVRKILPRSYPN